MIKNVGWCHNGENGKNGVSTVETNLGQILNESWTFLERSYDESWTFLGRWSDGMVTG